jgi:TatD DNase family protein
MQLVDSHAHLDFEDFHGDFDAVLKRAEEAKISKIINIGASLERSRTTVLLAENYENIFAVVGVHPEESDEINFDTIHDELIDLAKSSPKVVGIGETGLDYYRLGGTDLRGMTRAVMTDSEKKNQINLFQIHIDVARHLGLPLVIHIRNGEDEEAVNTVYETLKDSGYTKGVIHCFTLNADWAKRFVKLGFFLGFTGIITYKNAEVIRDAVAATPLENILVETDSPFLAPQKYRGQRNEPAFTIEVAKKISEIKEITLEKVSEQTTINVRKLFNV